MRYGGGVTAVMTSVQAVESGNCHFTKATAEPTDGDTNLTITAKYQTRKGEFFSSGKAIQSNT